MVRLCLIGFCVVALACKPAPRDGSKPSSSVRMRVEAEKSAPRMQGLGVKKVSGDVRELRASPDGQVLTVLVDAATPTVQGAPPTLKVGELYAAPVGEGEAHKIARDVVNMPGGWLFSADSKWLVVTAAWDTSAQAGELLVQDARALGTAPKRIAAAVTYFVMSEDSTRLAFVEGGVLHAGPLPDGPFPQVAGDVATAEFGGADLYFRRKFGSGGTLARVVFLPDGKPEAPKTIIDYAGDYAVTNDGKYVIVTARGRPNDLEFQLHAYDIATRKTVKLADDAARFRVTRDGRFVSWRSLSSNNIQADIGELWLAELGKGEPRKLGGHVKDFDFSPDSKRLVYRENFKELVLGGRDAKPGEQRMEKVGDLYMAELPDGAPKLLQRMCPNFLFSGDGKALAYTARVELPDVTRRLFLWREGGEVRAVKDWLYEYQFRPPGSELVFRADCLREGRACDLLTLPIDAKKETLPTKHAAGTFSVRFSGDGAKALIASAHLTDQSFDISLRDFASGEQKAIDQFVDWPALLVGDHGTHVAYLVNEKKRAGLYVATMK